MANRRFIDFPIASTVGDNDIVLIWQDGANKQTTKATILSGLPENLDELNDVVISGLTNGQILRYDSVTGKWVNTDQGNLDLNDLNDVSIVSPSNGQVLVYNSSTGKWENSSGGYVPYTGAVTTVNLGAQTIQAGSFVKAGGTSSQFLKADGSVDSNTYGTGTVTSVGITMPSAFSVANSPITSSGTLAVTGAGTVGQYIRGDGSLADFPSASGGGSSVSYYLNGSVAQGTIGGVAYKELSKVPVLGTGTDFTINADGYIASFLTDAGDPNLLEIPGGNWNFETYFSASSSGGTPTFYVELYKYDGSTFTLIASNSGAPEFIAFGTTLTSYFSTLAVPTTALALTDRLAIRYYVNHSGRTITLHTEDNHLCQVITTFTTGLTALNGLTAQVQNFSVGTSGSDFNIASASATHTFNLPTASGTNRGALSSADWSTFNAKQNALTLTTTGTSGAATLVGSTLNIPNYSPDLSGYVPTSRTITINGTTQDLSANRTFNVGTVTSVGLSSATSGVTIGSTPVTSSGTITLAIATASGSQQGLLSAADWTTFNNKQNALTNPVTGTGTTNYLAKFTGGTTIGNSQVFDNGTNVGIGTASPGSILEIVKPINTSDIIPVTGVGDSTLFSSFLQGSTQKYGLITGVTYTTGILWIQSKYRDITGTLPMSLQPLGGNVLIGTTSDNGSRLQVSGSATIGGNLTISSGNNLNMVTGDIYFQSNGGYGILSANASRLLVIQNSAFGVNGKLTITADAANEQFLISRASNTNAQLILGYHSDGYGRIQAVEQNVAFRPLVLNQSGGNVLIGTTTDTGERLQVSGNIRTNSGYIQIRNSSNPSLYINNGSAQWQQFVNSSNNLVFSDAISNVLTLGYNGGNVGIGNSSPNTRLEVASGNPASAEIQRWSYNDGNPAFSLRLRQDVSSGLVKHVFDLVNNGTTFSNNLVLDRGNVGIGTTSPSRRLTISNPSNGDITLFTNTSDADLLINLTSGVTLLTPTTGILALGTSSTERMRITSGGNVGIGTSSPAERLHVETSSEYQITWARTGAGKRWAIGTDTAGFYFNNRTDSILPVYITNGGNVGIGNTNPLQKLHITQASDTAYPTLGTGKGALFIAGDTNLYGLYVGINTNDGNTYFQAMRNNSATAYNITMQAAGGNVLIGTTTDNGAKLNVNGTIRTANPTGSTSDGWLLGRALVSGTSTPDRWIRVQIGNLYYDILAVYMGSV